MRQLRNIHIEVSSYYTLSTTFFEGDEDWANGWVERMVPDLIKDAHEHTPGAPVSIRVMWS